MKKILLLILLSSTNLTACATATRGGTTLFTVKTMPIGAHVSTTLPINGSQKMTKLLAQGIKSGKETVPNYTFRECEPTPCGIEMPRKADFKVLITKPGYAAQVHTISHKTRKEIKRMNDKKVALSAGAAGAGGAAIAGSIASSLGAGVTGAAVGGAAIVAAPVLIIGLVAKGIDGASGANFDLWPNPVELELLALSDDPDEIEKNEQIIKTFKQEQPHTIVDILLNNLEEEKAKAKSRKRQPGETEIQFHRRKKLEKRARHRRKQLEKKARRAKKRQDKTGG